MNINVAIKSIAILWSLGYNKNESEVHTMCNKNQLDEIINKIVAFSREIFKEKFESVILYGSYARGDYDEESDIDIMIMVDMSRDELRRYRMIFSEFFSDINLKYGVFLTSKLQSKSYFNDWQDAMPFYQNVIKEGVVYA